MGAGLFWGLILILIGIGIVIRVVFNIDFPVVKFLIAFFFIFIGIKILGGTVLKIDDKTPVKMKAEAVFGNAELPNGNAATFGTNRYESESFNKDTAYLYVKADVVFGSLKVKSY